MNTRFLFTYSKIYLSRFSHDVNLANESRASDRELDGDTSDLFIASKLIILAGLDISHG